MSGEKYKPQKSFDEAYKDFLEKESKTVSKLPKKSDRLINQKPQSIKLASQSNESIISLFDIAKLSVFTSLISLAIGYLSAKSLLEIPKPEPIPIHSVKSVF